MKMICYDTCLAMYNACNNITLPYFASVGNRCFFEGIYNTDPNLISERAVKNGNDPNLCTVTQSSSQAPLPSDPMILCPSLVTFCPRAPHPVLSYVCTGLLRRRLRGLHKALPLLSPPIQSHSRV